jgi:hypothetical protein
VKLGRAGGQPYRIKGQLKFALDFAAVGHGFAHIRVVNCVTGLEPFGFGHRAEGLVVAGVFDFIGIEISDERIAERFESLASGFDIFGLGELVGLVSGGGRKHFHGVAFDLSGDIGGGCRDAIERIFGESFLDLKVTVIDGFDWFHHG